LLVSTTDESCSVFSPEKIIDANQPVQDEGATAEWQCPPITPTAWQDEVATVEETVDKSLFLNHLFPFQ
jgi:hypothetical protein